MVYKYKEKLEKQLKEKEPDVRMVSDMEEVILDRKWLKNTKDFPAYFMYRGLDEEKGFRYDVTEMPFKMLGKEYPKTKGHYHPSDHGEIYIVLEGKAIYLVQNKKTTEVVAIEATKGDVAKIPAGWGHITINPGPEKLLMANWVSPTFDSDYDPILKKEGGAYFYTKDGWIENENYSNLPDLSHKKAGDKIPDDLNFL